MNPQVELIWAQAQAELMISFWECEHAYSCDIWRGCNDPVVYCLWYCSIPTYKFCNMDCGSL